MIMVSTKKAKLPKMVILLLKALLQTAYFLCIKITGIKRLFRTYGNEIRLLDVTFMTTRYAPPLFFMVVKANVGYELAGPLLCEGGDTENIILLL